MISRTLALIKLLIRFGFVGISATLSYYLLSIALLPFSNVFLASLGGFAVAVFISYYGHYHVTFRVTGDSILNRDRILRFVLTALIGLALGQVIIYIASVDLHLPDWLALAAVVCTVPAFSFLLCQFWVFREEATL